MNHYLIDIIDDDQTTFDVLGDYLTLSGYQVRYSENGREGLERIRERVPDLILLDVQMPELDGFQTLQALQEDTTLDEIPVLMITSLNRTNLKVKGLTLGAEDYIIKPFDRAELLARIKRAMRRTLRYRKTSDAMHGLLRDVSLIELLQTFELGQKTARLQLPEMRGTICLAQGMIVAATQGEFTGEDAMLRLLFLERGSYSVEFGCPPEEPLGKPLAVQHLIMNCATLLDELNLLLGNLTHGRPLVATVTGASCLPDNALWSQLLPLPVREFLVLLPGPLKTNTQRLVEEVARGTVLLEQAAF